MTSEEQIRMQYLGALNFIAEHSVYWTHDHEGQEAREVAERIFTDATRVIPRLRWRRILDSFELELTS